MQILITFESNERLDRGADSLIFRRVSYNFVTAVFVNPKAIKNPRNRQPTRDDRLINSQNESVPQFRFTNSIHSIIVPLFVIRLHARARRI